MVTLPLIALCGTLLCQAAELRVAAAPTAVLVDGRLDEDAWRAAEAVLFAGVGAELRLTHDGESLYLGVEAQRLDEVSGVRLWVGPAGAPPTPVFFAIGRNAVGSFTGGEFLAIAMEGRSCLEVRVHLGALGLAEAAGADLALLASAESAAGSAPLEGGGPNDARRLRLEDVDVDRFRVSASIEGLPARAAVGTIDATVRVRNRSGANAAGTVRIGGAESRFAVSPGQSEDVPIRFLLSGLAREGLSVDLYGEDGALLHRSLPTSVDVEPLVTVRTAVPSYRATVFGSNPVDEGLFSVTVRTPRGMDAVDLTGALFDALTGQSLGEQTLDDAPAGAYQLSFEVVGRAEGLYRFEATVRDGDAVLDRATSPLRILAYREPEVTIDGRGCLRVFGQPVFVLGVMGDVESDLPRASDLGFGLVLEDSPVAAPGADIDSQPGLALAVLVPPTQASEVARLSLSPRLGAWWLERVEPEQYAWLASVDPFHPVVVAAPLDAPSRTDWQAARASGDIMLAPVGEGAIRDEAFAVRGLLNGDEWRRPVWCRVKGSADRALAETSALAYACVIAGARGIVFDAERGSIEDLAERLAPLLQELAYLADVLRAPVAPVVPSSSDPRVLAGLRVVGDAAYVIVVNASEEEVTAELSDLSIVSATSVFEERQMTVTADGAFTDTYEPYAARLYRAVPR